MRGSLVPDADSIYRHAIYPAAYKTGKQPLTSARFDLRSFLHLKPQPDGTLETSFVWERYAPTEKELHAYGCRLAHGRNAKLISPASLKYRNMYCGAYQCTAREIRAIPANNPMYLEKIEIRRRIESGEIAHTEFKVFLKGNYSAETLATVLFDRIWHCLQGPLRHCCNCDVDVKEQNLADKLDVPPKGRYSDKRSWLRRAWHILRFRFEHSAWCAWEDICHNPCSETPCQGR
jgi:hypothetical protein